MSTTDLPEDSAVVPLGGLIRSSPDKPTEVGTEPTRLLLEERGLLVSWRELGEGPRPPSWGPALKGG
jgi:hypothetical protein